jgi:hypothetical protein
LSKQRNFSIVGAAWPAHFLTNWSSLAHLLGPTRRKPKGDPLVQESEELVKILATIIKTASANERRNS